jgi:hypothetical protein
MAIDANDDHHRRDDDDRRRERSERIEVGRARMRGLQRDRVCARHAP